MSQTKTQDDSFMSEALNEARKALDKLEIPVGAVIVKDGEIIARGHNNKESLNDPTSHAEIMAIREAASKLGTWRLSDCSMYVTLEPCAMCAGAIIQARIKEVYFGTPDLKTGAAGSVVDLLKVKLFNHKVVVNEGILRDECSNILSEFFKKLR